MNKKYLYLILIVVIFFGIFIKIENIPFYKNIDKVIVYDYKNATYDIDGNKVQLKNGYSESVIPQSSSKVITNYFGNELITDLNNDGRNDIVFLVTQNTGGTGSFFYVVAAINTENGYIGSDAYFLGDRISPQTTELSKNVKHKNVIVVNYADRKANEAMTVQPSIGKSAYLKLDIESMKWGIVVSDFEGESR